MQEQLNNTDKEKPLLGVTIPSRGVLEVKPTSDELDRIVATRQVNDYLQRYGLVLVTNFRDFVLLERGGTENQSNANLSNSPRMRLAFGPPRHSHDEQPSTTETVFSNI